MCLRLIVQLIFPASPKAPREYVRDKVQRQSLEVAFARFLHFMKVHLNPMDINAVTCESLSTLVSTKYGDAYVRTYCEAFANQIFGRY
jgi:hypothetical protein